MSTRPFFHFYTAEFLGDTSHLTHTERSMYVLLLLHQYTLDGPFPVTFSDTHGDLFRVARCASRRDRACALKVLKEFFEKGPDGWWQKRAKSEITKRKLAREKQSAAGKEGAKRRWGTPSIPHAEQNGVPHRDPMSENMASRARPELEKDQTTPGLPGLATGDSPPARTRARDGWSPQERAEMEAAQAELEQRRAAAGIGQPPGPRPVAEVLDLKPGNPEPGNPED